MHEIVALHRCRVGCGQEDGTGVVDQNIDAAKGLYSFVDCGLDVCVVTDIDFDRQRLAASLLNFLCRGVDGAWQARVRFGGLGCDNDVGAIGGCTQRYGFADTAAATGDEEGLACKCAHVFSLSVSRKGRSRDGFAPIVRAS